MPACQSGRHEAKGAGSGRAVNRWLCGNPACPTSIIERQRRDGWTRPCVCARTLVSHCLRELLSFTNLLLFCHVFFFFFFGPSLFFFFLFLIFIFSITDFTHKYGLKNASSYISHKSKMLRCRGAKTAVHTQPFKFPFFIQTKLPLKHVKKKKKHLN